MRDCVDLLTIELNVSFGVNWRPSIQSLIYRQAFQSTQDEVFNDCLHGLHCRHGCGTSSPRHDIQRVGTRRLQKGHLGLRQSVNRSGKHGARSLERRIGNMTDFSQGSPNSVGPGLCSGLKKLFSNDVACQGVSGPAYSAGLMDNVTPKGTTASAIAEAQKHIKSAIEKCPSTTVVAGGFRYVPLSR